MGMWSLKQLIMYRVWAFSKDRLDRWPWYSPICGSCGSTCTCECAMGYCGGSAWVWGLHRGGHRWPVLLERPGCGWHACPCGIATELGVVCKWSRDGAVGTSGWGRRLPSVWHCWWMICISCNTRRRQKGWGAQGHTMWCHAYEQKFVLMH